MNPATGTAMAKVSAKARELGFALCRVARADAPKHGDSFVEWLAAGQAGDMAGWLGRSREKRVNPQLVLPGAQSVLVLAMNYWQGHEEATVDFSAATGRVARYAWGDDYHDVIGRRLEALLSWMRERSSEPFDARAYVDTGPVQERVYAQHAGIGWIGKNTCVINPEIGSWVFLSAIICGLPLDVDAPSLDQCGSCTLCIEACPTQAIVAAGVLDSTRCISYLTIELRGDLPDPLRAAVGSHVYGCDVCQEVCPWNSSAPRSDDPAWQPRAAWDRVDLLTLAQRSDNELAEALHGSPMKRTKAQGLRRNVAVALENTAGRPRREADSRTRPD